MPKPDLTRLRRAATTAVVFDQRGRVLLHLRTDNGLWALPGGAIEVGERADEAIVREVAEETGFAVEVVRLVGIYSDPENTTITYPNGDVAAYVSLLFEAKVVGGEARLSAESAAVDWFLPSVLPKPFLDAHGVRIADAVAGAVAAVYR